MKKPNSKHVSLFLVGAAFVGALSWTLYQEGQNRFSDEAIMEKLSRIIVLPEEVPSIATVTDVEKLKNEPFFAKAQNGDKVIVYSQAKRALLYRPSENKIIDITVIGLEAPLGEEIPVFQTEGE